MWITHMDSEVEKFHPVCEKALNQALVKLSKDTDYEVLHHQKTGRLEMDFVIQNKTTKKYLCVVEVKRTPSDVNSARNQYQAMSYVQMNAPISEKPFYVLTNLEYAISFRYDPARPRVFQQMLEPGVRHIGDFAVQNESEFGNVLADTFMEMIAVFLRDTCSYLLTLEKFESHMRNITNNTSKWKSSLVVLLYEYIRGAFISIGRQDLSYDVRKFRSDIKRVCTEAANVNFKEIFDYVPGKLEKTASIANDVLANIFDFGKQTISGDSICDILHSIVSAGLERDGVVSTDLELARIMATLAKSQSGDIEERKYICDPAAGSGNLISAATKIFNVLPNQIKANDINERLLELLSLRIGLNFAKTVNNQNTAHISAKNIVNLPNTYFDNVAVIVMNPPFVAGINCQKRKEELFEKIHDIKQSNAVTNVGQMNLEGAFLETICTMCKSDTIIACVLPNTHLAARGKEAVALRRYLLSDFGLTIIFSYPMEGLFKDVVKGTCVVVGRARIPSHSIKIISSIDLISNIDIHAFGNAITKTLNPNKFATIVPGVEGFSQTKEQLSAAIDGGWRQVCREFDDALTFQTQYIMPNKKLAKMTKFPPKELIRKRGTAGNSGASNLLMIERNKPLFRYFSEKPTIPAMRNAKYDDMFIAEGDTVCFDALQLNNSELDSIVHKYLSLTVKTGQQPKKVKSVEQLKTLLLSTSKNAVNAHAVLIPRAVRAKGKVYVTQKRTIVSTNLIVISLNNKDLALILASWVSTIFYQLICEINAKSQEGMRKMEVKDVEATYIPDFEMLTDEQKSSVISGTNQIDFLTLNTPEIRAVDVKWAEILFGENSDTRLSEAKRLLEFLANTRNPLSLEDE